MELTALRNLIIDKDDITEEIIYYSEHIKENNISTDKSEIRIINKAISDKLQDNLYEEDTDIFDNLPYLFDAIKNKLASLEDKNNILVLAERDLLNETKKTFFSLYKLNKECSKKSSNENKSYSKIIDYFLSTEFNYLELKSIVDKYPHIINTRYNGEHIVFHILDLYMDNFKNMLKKESCINKDYLKEIYYLFTKNYSLNMSTIEKNQIDLKLKRFDAEIRKMIKKRYKANEVSREIDLLKSEYFYLDQKFINQLNSKQVDYDKLFRQVRKIANDYPTLLDEENRVDLTNEQSICLNGNVYSIEMLEDGMRFKCHSLNLKSLVPVGSYLDIYLYNCLLEGIEPDRDISDSMLYKKGKNYPTITYDFKVSKIGIVSDLKIYPSKINITDKIGLLDYLPKNYISAYKRISNQLGINMEPKGIKEVNDFFESVLNKLVASYMFEKRIPFIYAGSKFENLKDSASINNALIDCLKNLDKKELKTIKKLIEDANDPFHYSAKYFGDDGKYKLNLVDPFNYLNLEYQRTVNYFVSDSYKMDCVEISNLKREKKKRNELLVQELNRTIKYVESETTLRGNSKFITNRDIDKRFKSSKIEI